MATMSDAELLERYRSREEEIAAMIRAMGECPFCGWTGYYHQDGCALAPIEPLNVVRAG